MLSLYHLRVLRIMPAKWLMFAALLTLDSAMLLQQYSVLVRATNIQAEIDNQEYTTLITLRIFLACD